MDPLALVQQFHQAHPLYLAAASFFLGVIIGPWAINKAEAAIPGLVDWADARQDRLLHRAGLTPEQIKAVKLHEVADMRRAADELEARIKADALEHPPAPPAA